MPNRFIPSASALLLVVAAACEPSVGTPEPVVQNALRPPPQCPLPEVAAVDPGPLPDARAPGTPRQTGLDITAWNERCDVGAVGVHRLNRTELENSMQALLNVSALEVGSLPVDDSLEGFDNLADVLAVSPLLLEKVAVVSQELLDKALAPSVPVLIQTFEAENLQAETGNALESFYRMNGPGTLRMLPNVDAVGTYIVRVRAWGERAGADLPLMGIVINDVPQATFEVTHVVDEPGVYEATLTLEPDDIVGVTFANDYFFDSHPDIEQRDRNLVVDFIELEGPLELSEAVVDSPTRAAIITCSPNDLVPDADAPNGTHRLGENDCGKQVFENFASRAWRRPATQNELVRLLGFIDTARTLGTPYGEDPFEFGLRLGLRAILMSPSFLYRAELDPADEGQRDAPTLLSDHELASRLSYFLWSGPPDARLLEIAKRGRLQDDVVLSAEVRRMLADPRSRAFVENFAGQWLESRAVPDATPDPDLFPQWGTIIARQAGCETLHLFNHLLRTDAPVSELLTANYSFLTPDLATHYGIEAELEPGAYTKTSLDGTARQGVLTQASVLTVTSNPTRTSPVKRGKWVLEQLMCISPPPPPPGVEGLPENIDAETLRDTLAQHRADPACSSCHNQMDPIGLALENFDPTGQWRDDDNGGLIATSETFFTGEPFTGHGEMIDLVIASGTLERCTSKKMLTFALGRTIEQNTDFCAMDDITFAAIDNGASLTDIVVEIARSAPFRMRRATARDELEDGSDG